MSDKASDQSDFIPAIIYLSGDRRGTTSLLTGTSCNIVLEGRTGVRVERPGRAPDSDIVASLRVAGDCCEIEVTHDQKVWVNGRLVSTTQLDSGDVLEIGRNGPMLRYRSYTQGVVPRGSVSDVFKDCYDSARFDQGSFLRKTGLLFGNMTREVIDRTTLAFRIVVLIAIVSMIGAMIILVQQNRALEARVAQGESQTQRLAELLAESEGAAITRDDLMALRGEIEGGLSTAAERIEALESRFSAAARVVAEASRSVIFLQGSYGFEHAESGRLLRHVSDPQLADGTPAPEGRKPVTLGGNGPPVEIQFTGTGFIATDDGLVVTNRHVTQPWRGTEFASIGEAMGLRPAIRRFIGYLPGEAQAFEVDVVGLSDDADIAVLRCSEAVGMIPAIEASGASPQPGDEVIVLGYPAGVVAMLARSDQELMTELASEGGDVDFWKVGERLAATGQITPLATRGIVGQVTPTAVVYDAETTRGGSGGPVLNLDGRVIAVNAAILREFDGSNLGVPIARATDLLDELASIR